MLSVAFLPSPHGFGHASRQIEIINALGARLPDGWRILVRTDAPRWLFDRTIRPPFTLLPGATDTGVVQIDSLHLDEQATARVAAEFYADWGERVAREAALLHEHHVRLVISDAPPLACAAAEAAGIPSIVCANFTWDWIYEAYADAFAAHAPAVLPLIRSAYADASEAWRLPMHGGFATIRRIVDMPFVARHATRTRDEVIRSLGLPAERPLALTSFGGYGLEGMDWRQLDCLDEWTIVKTGREPNVDLRSGVIHLHEARIYHNGLRYEDLVAAVDVVVTKPGYGIVSECVANDTALLYTSRGHFVEYGVIVREMPRVLRCAHIDRQDLLAGRWLAALNRLRSEPAPPVRPPTNGAQLIADRILERIAGKS